MAIKFSIIFPTRERPELLKQLLTSIQRTACDLDQIEALIAYDQEDDVTAGVSTYIMDAFRWAHLYRIPRIPSISAYQNWLYKLSRGRYIMLVNDDCIFETTCWDRLLFDKLSTAFPDDVLYGWVNDGHTPYSDSKRFCNMPVVSRRAASVLGYVMNEHFRGWSADAYLYTIFRKLDRVVGVPDVMIRHLSKKGDAAQQNMEILSANRTWIEGDADAQKLKDFIDKRALHGGNPEDTESLRGEISDLLLLLNHDQLFHLRNQIYDFIESGSMMIG